MGTLCAAVSSGFVSIRQLRRYTVLPTEPGIGELRWHFSVGPAVRGCYARRKIVSPSWNTAVASAKFTGVFHGWISCLRPEWKNHDFKVHQKEISWLCWFPPRSSKPAKTTDYGIESPWDPQLWTAALAAAPLNYKVTKLELTHCHFSPVTWTTRMTVVSLLFQQPSPVSNTWYPLQLASAPISERGAPITLRLGLRPTQTRASDRAERTGTRTHLRAWVIAPDEAEVCVIQTAIELCALPMLCMYVCVKRSGYNCPIYQSAQWSLVRSCFSLVLFDPIMVSRCSLLTACVCACEMLVRCFSFFFRAVSSWL